MSSYITKLNKKLLHHQHLNKSRSLMQNMDKRECRIEPKEMPDNTQH